MRSTASGGGFNVVVTLFLGSAGSPLKAQPIGGQVIAGTAAFLAGARVLAITPTSARASVDGQDFLFATEGRRRFVQLDAVNATLNRVISATDILPTSHWSNHQMFTKSLCRQTWAIPIGSRERGIRMPIHVGKDYTS